VAGNLARRHGIRVTLHPTPCSGVTAAVAVPPSLVAGEMPVPVAGYRPPVLEAPAPGELATPAGPPTPAPLPPLPSLPSLAALPTQPIPMAGPVRPEPIAAPVTTVDLASRVVAPRVVRTDPDAPPLTRRVPGAQPPVTAVHGLHSDGGNGDADGGNGNGDHADAPPPPGSADDVYRLLTDYTNGIRRGRDEASPVSSR
jgi:hypothetical protein